MFETVTEIIDSDKGTFSGIVIDVRSLSALATDSDIEGFVSFFFQLSDAGIFSDFAVGDDFNTELFDDIDFSIDDILLKFIGRNSIHHHTARSCILFEDGRLIS